MFGRQVSSPVVLDLIALLIIVVGFIFGVICLVEFPSTAEEHPHNAIVGIVINGFVAFIFSRTSWRRASAAAHEH